MSVGNTFHLSFLSTLTFVSNQFLSIYHIHSLSDILIYTSIIWPQQVFGVVARDFSLVLGNHV